MRKPGTRKMESSNPKNVQGAVKQPMVILHGIWMTHYRGWEPKIYAPGFSYPAANGWGGELFNFMPVNKKCYGHVEIIQREINGQKVQPQLNIQALGATKTADVVPGVLVVWTAPDPRRPGRTVVGWYKNASVFRHLQTPTGSLKKLRTFKRQVCSYRVTAAEGDCELLPPEKRQFTIPPKKRDEKGVPGRFGAFYPASHKPTGTRIERQIREFIAAHEAGRTLNNKKQRKGKPNILRRQEVEKAAIDFVWDHFENELGYELYDRQEDDAGYDLVATLGEETLCIEVKGRFGNEITADFSPNEYRAIQSAEKNKFDDGQYRICVVTDALGTPTLHHFIFWSGVEGKKAEWRTIDGSFPLKFKEVIAARVSLDQ